MNILYFIYQVQYEFDYPSQLNNVYALHTTLITSIHFDKYKYI